MHIRCEKCNTLYELDDELLPPNGAPVQCSKCQFVFKAYPGSGTEPAPPNTESEAGGSSGLGASRPAPTQAGESGGPGTAAGEAGPVQGAAAAGGRAPASGAGQESAGATAQAKKASWPASPATAAPEEPQFTADGRPIRKVPFPTEEPASAAARPVLGQAPSRPSAPSSARRRWALVVVPLAVALVLAAIIVWLMLGRHSGPAAAPQRAEGHSLLLRHERASPAGASSVTRADTRGRAHHA